MPVCRYYRLVLYSTSIVIWYVINSVWFHESGYFIVAFECNFYICVSEEVCDFPDLWGCIGESRPLGVVLGTLRWRCAVYFL
jgi:hypothetical protein